MVKRNVIWLRVNHGLIIFKIENLHNPFFAIITDEKCSKNREFFDGDY